MENTPQDFTFKKSAEPEAIELIQSFFEAAKEIDFDHLLSIMKLAEEHTDAVPDATKISAHPSVYGPVFGLWRRVIDPTIVDKADRPYNAVESFGVGTLTLLAALPEYARLLEGATYTQASAEPVPAHDTHTKAKPKLGPTAKEKIEIESKKRQLRRMRFAAHAGRISLNQTVTPTENEGSSTKDDERTPAA